MKAILPTTVAAFLLTFSLPAVAQNQSQMDHSAHGQHMARDAAPPAAPPAAPTDWAADRYHDRATMAAARKAVFDSTSDVVSHQIRVDELEWRAHKGRDTIAWIGKAWIGGDLDRFLIRTEGEAAAGGGVDSAEVRALWSHAISPYFNLETGIRHDFRPRPNRTYATVGVDGMLPDWIEFEGALSIASLKDFSKPILTPFIREKHNKKSPPPIKVEGFFRARRLF